MMPIFWDILIWVFLAIGVGFGVLGFFGLLIFPDIRSRMFTAIRAILISVSAIAVAVIIFGINGFLVTGGSQYATLIIHTLFFYGVVVVANISIARIILDRTRPESFCQANPETSTETEPRKEE
jgi:multisubunit Na+/H+ antiporter MnhG subunit